jgi:hypothetical protein
LPSQRAPKALPAERARTGPSFEAGRNTSSPSCAAGIRQIGREVRHDNASVPAYSAWIQLVRSSRLTVSSRAGWSVAMCPRIIPTTWSSLSPRATNPHSHRISFILAPPALAARLSVMPGCWCDLGILAPGADPDLRGAGGRVRRPAAGGAPARPSGPAAVHLPSGQPPPLHRQGRTGRGVVA